MLALLTDRAYTAAMRNESLLAKWERRKDQKLRTEISATAGKLATRAGVKYDKGAEGLAYIAIGNTPKNIGSFDFFNAVTHTAFLEHEGLSGMISIDREASMKANLKDPDQIVEAGYQPVLRRENLCVAVEFTAQDPPAPVELKAA